MTFQKSLVALCVLSAATYVQAEQIKDSYHPTINGSPVTLIRDNMITQALGGRVLDLDVWVGEFSKYDDNIYGGSKKTSAWIHSVAVGAKLEAKETAWKVRAETQMQKNIYQGHSEHNGYEGYFRANGSADFNPAFTGRAGMGFSRTYDNDSTGSGIFGLKKINLSAGSTFRPSPFTGIDIDYDFLIQRRQDEVKKQQDYDQHSVAVRPYHQLTSQTTVFVQIGYATADPKGAKAKKESNGSDAYTGAVGVNWKYDMDLNVTAQVGFKYFSFDKTVNKSDSKNSVLRPTFSVSGQAVLNEDWKLGADVSYAPSISATTTDANGSNYYDNVSLSAVATYSPGEGRFTFRTAPFITHESPSGRDPSSNKYGVQFGASYCITDWLNASAGYRFTLTDYSNRASYSRNVFTIGVAGVF